MFKKLIILALVFNTGFVFAKKVKFAVDMTGQVISPNGVHISGDFQTEAGYPTDWDAEATTLTKEGSTNIYSVTVNIPAFRKYEYKYVNGDKFYEVEFFLHGSGHLHFLKCGYIIPAKFYVEEQLYLLTG